MTPDQNPCGDVLSFFLKEQSSVDAERFKMHLSDCPACRQELDELRLAWQALPFELEEIEVPGELKSQVMDAILSPKGLHLVKPKRKFRFGYAAAAVMLFAAGGASLWGLSKPAASVTLERLSTPTQPVAQYSLKAFDQAMPSAKGNCWLMRQGEGAALVLQLSGLQPTSGQQAYQVWIIRGGKRLNGGTFRVDEQGNGLLMYDMKLNEMAFEAIGITLEPDSLGSQPRGKKVLGT